MKTTIELPDKLHDQAKKYAIDHHTTLKELFESAIRKEIAALESTQSVLEALKAADHELIEAAGRIATIEVKTRDPSNELSVEHALENIDKARTLLKNAQRTASEGSEK